MWLGKEKYFKHVVPEGGSISNVPVLNSWLKEREVFQTCGERKGDHFEYSRINKEHQKHFKEREIFSNIVG